MDLAARGSKSASQVPLLARSARERARERKREGGRGKEREREVGRKRGREREIEWIWLLEEANFRICLPTLPGLPEL